ncbi:hypothetical protein SADUNF_Sadunf19G0067700 [Salix dunnii]|uniref:tRNA-binding domain-containing protein n=1 Tax=Salix dunnii TaxID=1413687 RepID=A0A835J2E5_9ROSI|nr:hypothetical protein SADUNF_Sadunf19G0067700 [Salix dunnii]
MSLQRKQIVSSALSKHLSLSPEAPLGDLGGYDIKSLYLNILKSSGKRSPSKESEEVMKWISFAEIFPVDSSACFDALNGLNEVLALNSVLLGNGLTPSEADIIVFSVIHSSVIGLSHLEMEKLVHVMRWMDYIQSKVDFGNLFEKVLLKKDAFELQLQGIKVDTKSEIDTNAKKTVENTKNKEKLEADSSMKKSDAGNKSTGKKESAQEKKKPSETEAGEKDKELSVSLLNIQVGLIRKAWKHPSADSLLVEEIDIGVAKLRQVVSGLAKFCSPDDLTNRRVVLITNVKPGKLRDVMSEGLVTFTVTFSFNQCLLYSMFNQILAFTSRFFLSSFPKLCKKIKLDNMVRVYCVLLVELCYFRELYNGQVLCASNEDHTVVEPLLPPEGAKVGERVSFLGIDGKPEDVLNPKKKQLEKITPYLFTDDKGVATFKGIPFMTSGGPCTSSIPKASIK